MRWQVCPSYSVTASPSVEFGSIQFYGSLCSPLEAQGEPIRIVQVKLLHAVACDLRRVKFEAFLAQVCVSGINVRTSKINTGVLMGANACRVRSRRSRICFIHGIEHHLGAIELKQDPVVVRHRLPSVPAIRSPSTSR